MNERVEKRLAQVVWNQRQVTQKPDIKPEGKNWLMDTMPFHAVLKERLTDDRPLQYRAEGKYISFKPVGGLSAKGLLRSNKRSVAYKDGLGSGISIEVEVNQAHWKKLIKIDSLNALGDLTGREFIEYKFEVETDFDIPERENKKPRIRLGDNSCIEVSQAWDSTPEIKNKIPVRSFFKRENGKFYFIKQIPIEWLKTAAYPVWTDVDIVWGSAQEFGDTDHVCVYCQCCEIDTNKFVVVYMDVSDATSGQARVGTVSGTTITWGAVSEFNTNVSTGLQLGVCKLDTDKFVVVYGVGNYGYARVGMVATRTISWGTETEVRPDYAVTAKYPCCCQLETDKFAVIYSEVGAADIYVCTVSDSTITVGDESGIVDTSEYTRCCKLDTDKFVIFYKDDTTAVSACAFTVSGTDITPGTPKVIDDSEECNAEDCIQLDTNTFLICWLRYVSSVHYLEICTVSGTTITEGTAVILDNGNWGAGLAKIDSTHFVVVYIEGNFWEASNYCSFSGTTITLGIEEIFYLSSTAYPDVCLISPDKIAAVYQETTGGTGEAIIGDTPAPLENKSANMGSKMVAAGLI